MLTRFLRPQTWPLVTGAFSAALLAGAHSFEKFGGYAPCQMCLWQREAHWWILGVSIAALIVMAAIKARWITSLVMAVLAIALLASTYMGVWHMGVEYGWWEGPKICSGTAQLGVEIDYNSLFDGTSKAELPACGEVVWKMGLSMAGWNALLSLLMALGTLFVWKRSRA